MATKLCNLSFGIKLQLQVYILVENYLKIHKLCYSHENQWSPFQFARNEVILNPVTLELVIWKIACLANLPAVAAVNFSRLIYC